MKTFSIHIHDYGCAILPNRKFQKKKKILRDWIRFGLLYFHALKYVHGFRTTWKEISDIIFILNVVLED